MNFFTIQRASILKKGETRLRLPLQVNSSDFRQILHYFTTFDQCFNGRQFLMKISVNEIIIGASKTNGPGIG